MFTTTKAAELLGLARTTVQKHIKSGNIAVVKDGRDYLISPEELERFRREKRPAHRPRKDKTMDWRKALEIMNMRTKRGEADYTDEQKEEAFDTVSAAVLRHTGAVNDEAFSDWLVEGDYDGTESAEQIAGEWLALGKD